MNIRPFREIKRRKTKEINVGDIVACIGSNSLENIPYDDVVKLLAVSFRPIEITFLSTSGDTANGKAAGLNSTSNFFINNDINCRIPRLN